MLTPANSRLRQAKLLLLCLDLALGLRTRGDNEIVGRPSVIIAGIGDSGTTAVTRALQRVGLEHCKTRDQFEEPPWGHKNRSTRIRQLLNVSNGEFTLSAFRRDPGTFEETVRWLQFVAYRDHRCIVQQRLNASLSVAKDTLGLKWGFKEPHYAWLLPVMDAAFHNKSRYLLVARDPRDICTNDIQDQFKRYARWLNTTDCYLWWATLWSRLLATYEQEPRFAIIRIEDLVVPDPSTSSESLRTLGCAAEHIGMRARWAHLLSAITAVRLYEETVSTWMQFDQELPGSPMSLREASHASVNADPQWASRLKAAAEVKSFHRHNLTYMGHHMGMNDTQRQHLVTRTSQAPSLVRHVMLQLGYDPEAFRLLKPTTRACLCHRT